MYMSPAIWAASVAQWKSTRSREQSVVGSNPTWGSSFFFGKKEFVSGVVVLYCVALYVVSFDHVTTQYGVWRHWWFYLPRPTPSYWV